MPGPYDVFLSHAWADGDPPRRLADALTAAGLRVWFDAAEIDDFASITRAVVDGLAQSKVLVAYYSKTYPRRRGCQWELTAAYLAAQREGDPRRRVLVVNAEQTAEHIHPIELRDAKFRSAPRTDEEWQQLAQAIVRQVSTVEGVLPETDPIMPPVWHGTTPVRYERFVGRFEEMWRIHSALHETAASQITGAAGQAVAQVNGLGGTGKSLLAREYALRFGSAYPGGVFWLRAHGNDDSKAGLSDEAREAERNDQVHAFARGLGLQVQGKPPDEVVAVLRHELERRALPCLWIVDDLPSGLTPEAFQAWCAPHPIACTLVTTRTRTYANLGSGRIVSLDVLPLDDAYQLLTSRRTPANTGEEEQARELANDLGCHALALDVTASAILEYGDSDPYRTFRGELANQQEDALEFAKDLVDALPSGHEPSIVKTMLRSIRVLAPEGLDFLRLASVLSVAPISASLVASTFQTVDALEPGKATQRQRKAFHDVTRASLAEIAGEHQDARLVHTLVSRVTRFQEMGAPERIQAHRRAVIATLRTEIAEAAGDARLHKQIEFEVSHARQLVTTVDEPVEGALLGFVGRYDLERGSYSSARALFERQYDFCRHAFGEEAPITLGSMAQLARCLERLGEVPAAVRLQEQVFDVRLRELGVNHPDTLSAMSSLAWYYRHQGELEASRQIHELALGARRRLNGPEDPRTLHLMDNLAVVLRDQGNVAGARTLAEEALAISRRVLSVDDPVTLSLMSNLASTLWMQRDLAAARSLEEEVLSVRRRTLGPDHPDVLNAMNSLTATLHAQGDLAGARALQQEVFELVRRLLGEKHPHAITAAWNLFMTCHSMGDVEAARAILERDLLWVLGQDPALLSVDMRGLQENLAKAAQYYSLPPTG